MRVDEGGGKWGWFLLRQSLHDPVMVLNLESEVAGGRGLTLVHFSAQLKRFLWERGNLGAV